MPSGDASIQEVEIRVRVETAFGSKVRAVGACEMLGRWKWQNGLDLKTSPADYPIWSVSVPLLQAKAVACRPALLDYKFAIVTPQGAVQWEEGANRHLPVDGSGTGTTPCFGDQKGLPVQVPTKAVTFEVTCADTLLGDHVVVVGCAPSLGSWSAARGLQLTTDNDTFPVWTGTAELDDNGNTFEWKLAIASRGGALEWETSGNRRLELPVDAEVEAWAVMVQFGSAFSVLEPRQKGQSTPIGSTGGSTGDVRPSPRSHRTGGFLQIPRRQVVHRTLAGDAFVPQSGRRRSPSVPHIPVTPNLPPLVQPEGAAVDSGGLPLLSHDSPSACCPAATQERVAAAVAAADAHFISFRPFSASAAFFASCAVEVVFDDIGSHHELTRVGPELRWEISFHEAGVGDGLHVFHFKVAGRRFLSADHPIVGDSNVALVCTKLRKYLLTRGLSDLEGFASFSRPFERTPRSAYSMLSARSWGSRSSRGSQSWGSPTSSTADDEDRSRPSVDTVPWEEDGTPSGLVKPHSIGSNLSNMGATFEEVRSRRQRRMPLPSFRTEVYEGLYDAELRLRLHGCVVPEPPPAADSRPPPVYRLAAGAHRLKKDRGACEDACFVGEQSVGVADGVGGMVPFQAYGVCAAVYAAELMAIARTALEPGGAASEFEAGTGCQPPGPGPEERAVAALRAAEEGVTSFGASTIALATLQGSRLGIANLGDSGFMLLRKGRRGMEIVAQSEEQTHSWNCPYQLMRLPPELSQRLPHIAFDTFADADRYALEPRCGDLLLLFTDGFRDNLHDSEILHIVDCTLSPELGALVGLPEHATSPEHVARSLALAAYERSTDPSARVPFAENARKQGYFFSGGKQDDITVVAAWIMEDGPFIEGSPGADQSPSSDHP